MGELTLTFDDGRDDEGPAMSALTDPQRRFVMAMMLAGPSLERPSHAAAAAGYSKSAQSAYHLMRNPRILAALKEEAGKRLIGAALVGVDVMLKIATNDQHKDQFRAAKELAAINGFTVEQKITVTHVKESQETVVAQIRDKAARLGVDPAPLLAAAGIIDAEFVPVVEPEADWSVTA